MSELSVFFRPHILKITPYSSARDEFVGSAPVMLDANENGNDWLSELDHVGESLRGTNRYPDPHQRAIKMELARIKSVSPAQIFVGNGSDEAIDLIFRLFCNPAQDRVIVLPPTYGMYGVSAQINNIEIVRIMLNTRFEPDICAIKESLRQQSAKVLFLCSPNNPTSNACHLEIVKEVLDVFPGIVVVDEAYIDFSSQPSALGLLAAYPRLVVLQTFSKAWGMAGLRVGLAYAHEEIIEALDRIKPPYNVNLVSQRLVLSALSNEAKMQAVVCEIREQRAELAGRLKELNFVEKIYPSDANFLLVKFDDSARVFAVLSDAGVVVRDRSREPLCGNCLRITVGTSMENQKLVEVLRGVS